MAIPIVPARGTADIQQQRLLPSGLLAPLSQGLAQFGRGVGQLGGALQAAKDEKDMRGFRLNRSDLGTELGVLERRVKTQTGAETGEGWIDQYNDEAEKLIDFFAEKVEPRFRDEFVTQGQVMSKGKSTSVGQAAVLQENVWSAEQSSKVVAANRVAVRADPDSYPFNRMMTREAVMAQVDAVGGEESVLGADILKDADLKLFGDYAFAKRTRSLTDAEEHLDLLIDGAYDVLDQDQTAAEIQATMKQIANFGKTDNAAFMADFNNRMESMDRDFPTDLIPDAVIDANIMDPDRATEMKDTQRVAFFGQQARTSYADAPIDDWDGITAGLEAEVEAAVRADDPRRVLLIDDLNNRMKEARDDLLNRRTTDYAQAKIDSNPEVSKAYGEFRALFAGALALDDFNGAESQRMFGEAQALFSTIVQRLDADAIGDLPGDTPHTVVPKELAEGIQKMMGQVVEEDDMREFNAAIKLSTGADYERFMNDVMTDNTEAGAFGVALTVSGQDANLVLRGKKNRATNAKEAKTLGILTATKEAVANLGRDLKRTFKFMQDESDPGGMRQESTVDVALEMLSRGRADTAEQAAALAHEKVNGQFRIFGNFRYDSKLNITGGSEARMQTSQETLDGELGGEIVVEILKPGNFPNDKDELLADQGMMMITGGDGSVAWFARDDDNQSFMVNEKGGKLEVGAADLATMPTFSERIAEEKKKFFAEKAARGETITAAESMGTPRAVWERAKEARSRAYKDLIKRAYDGKPLTTPRFEDLTLSKSQEKQMRLIKMHAQDKGQALEAFKQSMIKLAETQGEQ